jgi:hypothetical protein
MSAIALSRTVGVGVARGLRSRLVFNSRHDICVRFVVRHD